MSAMIATGQTPGSTPNDQPQKPRLKIGLVLSGGGARGFAHIGVLKVLEENRIPVDYISGASMGALIGSLYSTGKTPAEMEKLVEDLNWEKLLSGSPSYEELSFRRKQDRRNIPGALTLSGRNSKSLKLPGSLNPGHEIGLLIDNLFLPYSGIKSFDDLPIPFHSVATDMINAETVELKDGSLQQALRATMAVPAIFAPVELDGKILADGGILNNIPTDLVKRMGADIIIVINIETQVGDRSSLDNLIGVLGQTFIVASVENSRRSLREADLIIAPDLGKYSSSNYADGKEIVELGYLGGKEKVNLLKGLSLSEEDWNKHLQARRDRQIPETNPITTFLEVEGAATTKEREILREKLSVNLSNQTLDKAKIEKDLTALTGTRRFDSLGYELVNRNGENGLRVRVYDTKERTERKSVLEVGVEVNNAESDNTNFNARGRYTLFDVGGFGSEWRNDFSIGSKTLFKSEYFRPLGETGFFVAPNVFYENRKVGLFEDGDRIAEYSFKTTTVGVDVGYSFNAENEIRAGVKIGRQSISRRIGSPLLPEFSGGLSVASIRHDYDGADNAQIPTNGFRSSSTINYYFDAPGVDYGFPQAETDFIALRPVSERYVVFGFGAAGTSFGKTAPTLQQFPVGGLFNVSGYGSEEFRGSNFTRGGFGFLRETYSFSSYVRGKIYFGAWYEGGSAFEKFNSAKYRQSVTTGFLSETPLGPIFIGGSFGEGGRRKLYFSLGRFF